LELGLKRGEVLAPSDDTLLSPIGDTKVVDGTIESVEYTHKAGGRK
jgi:hypothetical protein